MKEKDAPVDLCIEVLRRLDKAGVLQDIILVGSRCVYFNLLPSDWRKAVIQG